MFVGLTLFLGGVGVLEWVASHNEPRYLTISVVSAGDPTTATHTSTDHSWQGSETTGPEHARARALMRRGELGAANSIYVDLATALDAPVTLLTEVAYALRRADRCVEALENVQRAVTAAPDDGN
ncbi:MAG: hypothetical protein ACJAYU_005369, partial [Bradymonadia bacterium]